ncbi:MAG TPA: UDP-N-acetylmuramoyl-tripeptide--D-alanyl-D-alanine ligase [Salinimicrobium sp.]|nr:UDP-N-acetylmuramoyl-tripeptide--D-alanyl-D-alanine ligase [Salinimicrobium sp.]
MEIKELHRLFLKSSGVNTDTRKIKENSIFFALKGENFNGNRFAAKALENGSRFAVVDESSENRNPNFILVEDVLSTLQKLATFHRNFLGLPILALTGSNGKTTTKELINAVLSATYNTVATKGNLNNHIGVPLTLLSMNQNTEIGIVEMGANHPGEIAFLCQIAQPDFGYITNFGKAHLEGFKNLEGVIKAKSELYDFLKAHQKALFLNLDDPNQKKQLPYKKYFSFGSEENSDIIFQFPGEGPLAQISVKGKTIEGQLTGKYNSTNMAAAYAIGTYFEVPEEKIVTALQDYVPNNNRSQILEKSSNKILLDAYNANPTSMMAALENFTSLPESPKIVFLGDMFELGDQSKAEHQAIVDYLEQSGISDIYLIGENFFETQSGKKIKKYNSYADFKSDFRSKEIKNSLILIKGSRGMALERILEML